MEFQHVPVLLREVLEILAPAPGELFVDCTLGGGGHSRGILERTAPDGRLLGIDQDAQALEAARKNLRPFGDRVIFVHSNYSRLADILQCYAAGEVSGILFDLGVSSYQLDAPARGFSYLSDAPLDMRMDQSQPLDAWQVVNTYGEAELQRILREYGEERWAKRIAQGIVDSRRKKSIDTTGELVEVIKRAVPKGARMEGSHPAKRAFQAIRIEVNDELGVLKRTLTVAARSLRKGGRLGVISFHSLEDRIVKETFRYLASDCVCPPGLPVCQCGKVAEVRILTRKPLTAGEAELAANSRAKSAKLRAVERIL